MFEKKLTYRTEKVLPYLIRTYNLMQIYKIIRTCIIQLRIIYCFLRETTRIIHLTSSIRHPPSYIILLPSGRPREASHFFPLNRGTEGVSGDRGGLSPSALILQPSAFSLRLSPHPSAFSHLSSCVIIISLSQILDTHIDFHSKKQSHLS